MFLSKVKFAAIVVLALGLVGTGLGSLAHNTEAGPPSSLLLSVKEDDGRKDAPAADPNKAAAAAPAKPKPPAPVNNQNDPETRQDELRNQLNQPVDYPGLEDARATFTDVIDQLSKRYNLTFHLNERAFQALDPKIEVPTYKIAETPIPGMATTLKGVLQTILKRLPSKMGAMYVIRRDSIEITTEAAMRAELGVPVNRPFFPLVWSKLSNTPLAEALRHLSDQSRYNVIADPRVADKLKAPATAEINNVPLDTAVRLLANMAGLQVVRLDNVFYVTTAENAKQLREEQAKINADTSTKNAETPKKPAPDKGTK